jgi:uncharacterized protein YndB with AHSA1/START domain
MTIDQDQTADYQKTIRLRASASDVFDALTTVTGLSSWWTQATGSGEAGGEVRFFFTSPTEPCVMHVDQADRPTLVEWTVTECAFLPDWVGTRPVFTITPVEDGGSELHFRHHGLTPELECIEMCTDGWNTCLTSLSQFAESGQGSPFGS